MTDTKWRESFQYRADWEEFRNPVSANSFGANQKTLHADEILLSIEDFAGKMANENEFGAASRHKRRRTAEADIPILGAGAYAARAFEAGYSRNPTSSVQSDSDADTEMLVH